MTDQLGDKEVRKIRNAVRGLRIHALTYCAVNAGLFVINMLTSFGTWWFIYPLLGWGVGLAAHAFTVLEPGIGKDWEDRMVADIAAKRAAQKAIGQSSSEAPALPKEDPEAKDPKAGNTGSGPTVS